MAASLREIILTGENEYQDFKETISSAQKIAKTMVAFANTRGGKIFIGIRDNGSIRGCKPEEESYMIESAAAFFSKPEITYTKREIPSGGKTVLEINIPESVQKPHMALADDQKWWAYIRVKDKCLLASKTTLDVLRKEQKNENVLIPMGTKQQALLQYLSQHERITLPQFTKMVNISKWRARKILVDLALAGIIRIHQTEKADYYTLA